MFWFLCKIGPNWCLNNWWWHELMKNKQMFFFCSFVVANVIYVYVVVCRCICVSVFSMCTYMYDYILYNIPILFAFCWGWKINPTRVQKYGQRDLFKSKRIWLAIPLFNPPLPSSKSGLKSLLLFFFLNIYICQLFFKPIFIKFTIHT